MLVVAGRHRTRADPGGTRARARARARVIITGRCGSGPAGALHLSRHAACSRHAGGALHLSRWRLVINTGRWRLVIITGRCGRRAPPLLLLLLLRWSSWNRQDSRVRHMEKWEICNEKWEICNEKCEICNEKWEMSPHSHFYKWEIGPISHFYMNQNEK